MPPFLGDRLRLVEIGEQASGGFDEGFDLRDFRVVRVGVAIGFEVVEGFRGPVRPQAGGAQFESFVGVVWRERQETP